MLERSFGMFFFLKQPKNAKITERYVYLRITVNGRACELSTKRIWQQEKWSAKLGRATGNKESARELNSYLDLMTAQVYDVKKMLFAQGKVVSADAIKKVLLGVDEDRRTLLEVFQVHNDQMHALVGKEYAYATLQRFRTCLDHTRAFIDYKYQQADIDIREVNFEFISEFSFWLRTVKNCGHNSAVKYLTNLKKILLSCLRKGWIPRDPFAEIKLAKKEVEPDFLTEGELEAILTKKILVKRVALVRDIFVFSCYTGLAYVDVRNLRRSAIIKGIDGKDWIVTKRQKTDVPTRLPLLQQARNVMEQYAAQNGEFGSEDDFLLPILSNQKMNAYLKEVADLCGITKSLTFHTARHTFATTVTLSNGVPLETVSKMLGHKSLRQTQHYAKIIDAKVSKDMELLERNLRSKVGYCMDLPKI
jgi:site-specific recombinase XerD